MASIFHADNAFKKTLCNVVDVNSTQMVPCHYCESSRDRTCTRDHYNRRTCTNKRRCYDSRFPCAKILVSYIVSGDRGVTSHLHSSAFSGQKAYPQVSLKIYQWKKLLIENLVVSFFLNIPCKL